MKDVTAWQFSRCIGQRTGIYVKVLAANNACLVMHLHDVGLRQRGILPVHIARGGTKAQELKRLFVHRVRKEYELPKGAKWKKHHMHVNEQERKDDTERIYE